MPTLDKFKKDNFANDEEYRRALAAAGIAEQDLRDELLWQRRLLQFIDVRFRPGVQVSAQDIQDYFDKVVEPAAAGRPSRPAGEPRRLPRADRKEADRRTGR